MRMKLCSLNMTTLCVIRRYSHSKSGPDGVRLAAAGLGQPRQGDRYDREPRGGRTARSQPDGAREPVEVSERARVLAQLGQLGDLPVHLREDPVRLELRWSNLLAQQLP